MKDAVSVVITYIHHCLENIVPIGDKRFNDRSYSLWASYEILNRIQDNPKVSPIDIMEDFVLEMTKYAHISKNENAKNIFRTALDAGEYLITLVSSPEGE